VGGRYTDRSDPERPPRAGANLPVALQGLPDRTGLASLARFVYGIVIAVEWVTVHQP
jgi:hypothetical protein